MARAEFSVAGIAVRQIVVLVVVGIVIVDEPTAILAGGVVVLKTTVAKCNKLVTLRIVAPNPAGTAIADNCVIFKTVIAKDVPIEIDYSADYYDPD